MKKAIILFVFLTAFSCFSQTKQKYYIRANSDTLTITKEGRPTGFLNQFSEVEIEQEDSVWVKVIHTGWIKKEKLAAVETEPFDAGNNFFYSKLKVYKDEYYGGTRLVGEMRNNNDTAYKTVSFQVTIYTKDEEIIDTTTIFFVNFRPGEPSPFKERFPNIPFDKSNIIKIKFKLGNH